MLQERVWAPAGMQISNQSHRGWLITDDDDDVDDDDDDDDDDGDDDETNINKVEL